MIELNCINKQFDQETQALSNIKLSLKRNKIIGLMGQNGAGKTTLLEIILGLIQPTSGEIKSETIHHDDFGYLPDLPSFIEHITALEMVHYINLVRKLNFSKEELIAKLREFNLEENKHTPNEKLSRGMRQRLAYVLATLHNPSVLLLDEPFTGLDPVHLNMMKQHLLDFSKDKCIIFSTHIFSFASKLCNEYIFLDEGRIRKTISLAEGKSWSEETIEETFLDIING